jgi:hypothetical protein
LNSIGIDDFYLITNLNGEVHSQYTITLLDLLQDTLIKFSELGCLVETFTYCVKKTVLWIHGK